VAVFGTSTFPGNAEQLKETELAAGAFKVQLQYLDVLDAKDIETAFREANKGRAEAVLMLAGSVLNSQRKQLAELAVKSRLPGDIQQSGIFGSRRANDLRRELHRLVPARRHVCGQDFERRQARRSAVEQPKKFEFIISLKAAKQIGLTIPPNVLARADR
jgi:putative tryptophan/tyrosine transport system substrate-binding protein